MIPYARQDISNEDVKTVEDVLRSDWLTQGPVLERFENALTQACGARHAVATCNATAALHLACRALGLGPGDRLWTSPNTFVASANCARYCGAEVDFVDIDDRTYNMSVEALADKLESADRQGKLPKIVMPVHFAGQSCEMRGIGRLAERYGFHIIEDASHALGGSYLGEPIGTCTFSSVAVFSFHPVKIITTGEGGAVTTNDPDIAERIRLLRSHGISRDPRSWTHRGHGAWYYEQHDLGFNYRMTDFQAALGASQLGRLKIFIERRRELAARYDQKLHQRNLIVPWQHPDTQSAYHLYPIRIANGSIPDRRAVFDGLVEAGIRVNVHYIPVHLQPYYRALGFAPGVCPRAERYYQEEISLPMFAALNDEDQHQVIERLVRLLG